MSDDDANDSVPIMSTDREARELMGLFDLPAFARRGQDMEYSLNRVHARCRDQRDELLEMVRLRLRQWSRVAAGPAGLAGVFTGPIDPLWQLAHLEPPAWAGRPPLAAAARTAAADLVASVQRFNHRWRQFLDRSTSGRSTRQSTSTTSIMCSKRNA